MSLALVAAQFVLIVLLLLPASAAQFTSPIALALLISGALLGLWTLFFNRIGNFNIRPEPKDGSHLVTTGPYRFVRHPMYVAVLLVMAPFGFFSGQMLGPLFWLLLLAVLWKKSAVEEKMLLRQFRGYQRYMDSTGRFLPRLGRQRKDKRP